MKNTGHRTTTRPGRTARTGRTARPADRTRTARRAFGGPRARAAVAVLGAVALALTTTGCGEDEATDRGAGENRPVAGTSPQEDTEAPADDTTTDAEDSTDEDPATGTADDSDTEDATDRPAQADGADSGDRPYVVNFYGEENADGNPEREPGNLVVSEHSSIQQIEWQEWNGGEAVGTGLLSGIWCLPECMDEPFEATVTLSDPTDVNGDLYFSTFELEAPDADGYVVDDMDGERPLLLP